MHEDEEGEQPHGTGEQGQQTHEEPLQESPGGEDNHLGPSGGHLIWYSLAAMGSRKRDADPTEDDKRDRPSPEEPKPGDEHAYEDDWYKVLKRRSEQPENDED